VYLIDSSSATDRTSVTTHAAAFNLWIRDELTSAEAFHMDGVSRALKDIHYALINRAAIRVHWQDSRVAIVDGKNVTLF
jgi:hypothetical protein